MSEESPSAPPIVPTPDLPEPVEEGPKLYPGGETPDLAELFGDALQDLSKDLGPYALAGVGQMLVMVPVFFVVFFALYFGLIFLIIGGAIAGGILMAIAIEVLGPDIGGLIGAFLTLAIYFLCFVVLIGCMVLVGAVLAPINASLVRRIAMHQRGERELDLSACFSDATADIASVIGTSVGVGSLVIIGLLFCYIPGIAVAMLLLQATMLTVLHGLGPIAAIKTNLEAVKANPAFHIQFGLAWFVVAMIAGNIPILGAMYLNAVHVRCHRILFGDGEEVVIPTA